MAIFFVVGAKNFSEIERFRMRIQVMLFYEFLQTIRPHVVFRIVKIDEILCHLVCGYRIRIVRNSRCCPMMSGDDFHVPDIVSVRKQDSVSLRRTVLFNQTSKIFDAFFCGVDVRSHHVLERVFSQAVLDPRIICQCMLVSVD